MTYNDLRQIAKLKNILIKDLATEMGVTRQGLQKMIENETIELRLIKKMCEILNISASKFFELGSYGLNVNTGNAPQFSNKMELDSKDKEIEYLKQMLSAKDEIIELLRSKDNRKNHYGNVAEP